jgi:hypothetical protein
MSDLQPQAQHSERGSFLTEVTAIVNIISRILSHVISRTISRHLSMEDERSCSHNSDKHVHSIAILDNRGSCPKSVIDDKWFRSNELRLNDLPGGFSEAGERAAAAKPSLQDNCGSALQKVVANPSPAPESRPAIRVC